MHHFAVALGAITLALALNNIFSETIIFEDDNGGLLSFTKKYSGDDNSKQATDCGEFCIEDGYVYFFKVSQWLAGVFLVVYGVTDRLYRVAAVFALSLAVASILFLINGFDKADDLSFGVVSVVEFVILGGVLMVGFIVALILRQNDSDVVHPMVAVAWFYVGLAYVYLVAEIYFWEKKFDEIDGTIVFGSTTSKIEIDIMIIVLFEDISSAFFDQISVPIADFDVPLAILLALFAGSLMFKYLYKDIKYVVTFFATVLIMASSYFVIDASTMYISLGGNRLETESTTLMVEGGIQFVVFLVLVPLAVIWLDVKGNSSDYKFLGI